MKIFSITKIVLFIIEPVGISDKLNHIKREHVHNEMYVLSFFVPKMEIVKKSSKIIQKKL